MHSNSVYKRLRSYEWLLAVFFSYLIAVGISLHRPACIVVGLVNIALISFVAWLDNTLSRLSTSILRDWFAGAYILLAYWSLEPFARTGWDTAFQLHWLQRDHEILYQWGMQAAIESAGPLFPLLLETIYLSLYTLPVVLLSLLYLDRRRNRVEPLFFMIFSGALITYTIIAVMPSDPPRLAFPGLDLPHYHSAIRRLNLWIQNGSDIDTGVFPSGHVTVAFCSALAVLRVLPERKWLARSLFVYAIILTVATIYGRYHYAMDGLAAIVVSLFAFTATRFAMPTVQPVQIGPRFGGTKRLANSSLDV